MRLRVKSSNIFPLPGNPHMLHLATLERGLREFIVLHCMRGPHKDKTYIEEVVLTTVDFKDDVFANCKFVADDELANELAEFATDKGLLDIEKRLHQGSNLWISSGR